VVNIKSKKKIAIGNRFLYPKSKADTKVKENLMTEMVQTI
jgi:hypothetical protein